MKEISVRVGMLDVNVHVGGCIEGDALIFLHGFCANTRFYSKLHSSLLEISDNLLILAPEYSRLRVQPKTIHEYIDFVQSTIHELSRYYDLEEYDMLGHSLGGTISLYLAANEEKARSAIAMNPIIPTGETLMERVKTLLRKGPRELMQLAVNEKFLLIGLTSSWLVNLVHDKEATLELVLDVLNHEYELSNLMDKPAHILYGKNDVLFYDERMVADFAERKGIFLRILPWGHNWPITRPKQCAEEIRNVYDS